MIVVSQWLADNDQAPFKAHPTYKAKLPPLPFAKAEPAVGTRGDVYAFCTNVVHCGSRNIDASARKIMFINFCAAAALDVTAGNHDLVLVRTAWREALRNGFPPERRHLLDGEETTPLSPRL